MAVSIASQHCTQLKSETFLRRPFSILVHMDKSAAENRVNHLFIIRIWQEVGETAVSEWRGTIEHIPTQKRMSITGLTDLNDFISWRLAGAVDEQNFNEIS